MTAIFISAFVLGLLFNIAPGAIMIETIRRGLRGGFFAAFAVQIGSLVGDALWVVLGLSGAAWLVLLPVVQVPLSLFGAAFLFFLAFQSLRDCRYMPFIAEAPHRGRALWAGVALSVSNPLNIIYWAALGGTIGTLAGARPDGAHFAVFFAGFMLSSVLWCFAAAALVALTRSHLSPRLWCVLHLICGAGLFWLGAVVVYRVLTI